MKAWTAQRSVACTVLVSLVRAGSVKRISAVVDNNKMADTRTPSTFLEVSLEVWKC